MAYDKEPYGDIEGLGKIYDKNGNLILQKGENLLMKIPNVLLFNRFPHIDKKKIFFEIPSTVYITDKRVVGIRNPNPSKREMLEYMGFGIGTGVRGYENELRVQKNGGKIYQEFYWNEFGKIEVSSMSIVSKDGNIIVTKIPPLCVKNIVSFFERNCFNIDFWNAFTKKIFKEFLIKLRIEDRGGLNIIYNSYGEPIFQDGEFLISQGVASPYIALEYIILGKKYFVIKPAIGNLYKTNGRLIFIRKFTDENEIYYPLPQGTHIYFSINFSDIPKVKIKNNELLFIFSHNIFQKLVLHFPLYQVKDILGEYL